MMISASALGIGIILFPVGGAWSFDSSMNCNL
jgi:hypothetical protein